MISIRWIHGALFFLLCNHVFAQQTDDVVAKIWQYLGGKDVFYQTRYVQFTFQLEREGKIASQREHLWDRFEGRSKLQWRDREKDTDYLTYFNTNTRKGTVYKNKIEITGSGATELLDKSYAWYINDSYWLLAPAKLEDPGLNLSIDKERSQQSGQTVLHLTFENVGLTPGDRYWLYIDHQGKIGQWEFVLQSGYKNKFDWLDERDCGEGLRFSTRKVSVDGKTTISFPVVRFTNQIDPMDFGS